MGTTGAVAGGMGGVQEPGTAGLQGVQLSDHPPKLTPGSAGAVTVTVVGLGYVASQTEPPVSEPGPQWITVTGGVVAEGAVISQLL